MTKIRYVGTLVYCDEPQVFEARDAIGGHYIAVLGSHEHTCYLIAGISPWCLDAFRTGRADLRGLLTGSDAGSRYTTTSMPMKEDDELEVEAFERPLEGSGFLPQPGFTLRNPPLETPAAQVTENLRLELSLAAMSRIGTTAYTELLSRVQILVKHAARAAALEDAAGSLVRHRDDVFDVVVPASAGSFRIQLEASTRHGPEFKTRMITALRRIDELFRDSADTRSVLKAARENPRPVTWAYLKLLQLLDKNGTDLSYTWSRARDSRSHGGAVSSDQAHTLIQALAKERLGSETVVLEGKLYRCNSGTGFWGLETKTTRARGRVSRRGPSLDGLKVGGRYRFTCDVEHDFKPTSGFAGQLLLTSHEPLVDDGGTVDAPEPGRRRVRPQGGSSS